MMLFVDLMMLFAAMILAVAILLAWAAAKPDRLRVERSAIIAAPPRVIFQLINDLRAWEAWTPYDCDPLLRDAYSGPATGCGAKHAWPGNRGTGGSSLTITRSVPYSRVCLELDGVGAGHGHHHVVFRLHADMAGTRVSMISDKRISLTGKLRSLFVNVDREIGEDFELGLARLKEVAERQGCVSFLRAGSPV